MTDSRYSHIDGLRHEMEQRFRNKSEILPPNDVDYVESFHQIETYLNKHVHPKVGIGAALQGDGLLNDHGVEHVKMVIERAGRLLDKRVNQLSGFEIYILLLAIHFHDVGNIKGREEHEKRIFEVMDKLGDRLPLDHPTKVFIAKIAMAHGGRIDGDKDTIKKLQTEGHLHGMTIRPALLAAILRFSDEIADDHTRAERFLEEVNNLPRRNEIFHHYSKSLQPAAFQDRTLILQYWLPLDHVNNTSGKQNPDDSDKYFEEYLYDEILHRLKKCLCELEYCRKYSEGFIVTDSIQAEISVHKPNTINPIYEDKIILRLCGYPNTMNEEWKMFMDDELKIKTGIELMNECGEQS